MGSNGPPVKYEKTSVLLLGWAEDDDDTEAGDEVSYINRFIFRIVVLPELTGCTWRVCTKYWRKRTISPSTSSA